MTTAGRGRKSENSASILIPFVTYGLNRWIGCSSTRTCFFQQRIWLMRVFESCGGFEM